MAKRNERSRVRRNRKYNRNDQLLRTLAWAAVVVALAMVSHPATAGDQKLTGTVLAVALGATLLLTRDK